MDGFMIPIPNPFAKPDLRGWFIAELEQFPAGTSREVEVQYQLAAARTALAAGYNVDELARYETEKWGEGPTKRSLLDAWGTAPLQFRRVGQVHRFMEGKVGRAIGSGERTQITMSLLHELRDRASRVLDTMEFAPRPDACPIHGEHEWEDVFYVDEALADALLPCYIAPDPDHQKLWGPSSYLGDEYRMDLQNMMKGTETLAKLDADVKLYYYALLPGFAEPESTESTL